MDCSLRRFSLPLTTPLETAGGALEVREGFLVRIATAEAVGLGEATPLPGWTEPLEDCTRALEAAVERVVDGDGQDAVESMTATPAARHGIALALADLRAQRAATPLYRSLGSTATVGSVPANATIGDGSVEETVAAAEAAVGAEFSCLKLKLGARAVATDLERVRAVRGAVGPSIRLRLDANGAWGRDEAADALDELAGLDIDYVEQPLPAADLAGLENLQEAPVAIAVDEGLVHHRPETVVEQAGVDRVVLKPMVLGGPDRTMALARLAADHDVATTITTTVDAAVARAGAVHLAAAIDPGGFAGLATGDLLESDIAEDPAPVEAGSITVPQAAGHGVELPGWVA